jgi:peptidyl-prolyl cis-trans isomerase SurA
MSTAFRLKEGEISAPVKSKFGYHIIQMVQRLGDDAIVRHILRIPPVTDDEINEAKTKLDSIRANILAGKITFNAAAVRYSNDDVVKYAGPMLTNREGAPYVTIDQLDKDMVATISALAIGDISRPVAFTDEQNKKGVRLVFFKSRSEPHRMNLADDYSKISEFALEEKKAKELESWLRERIPAYYIMVDPPTLADCPNLAKFTDPKGF